MKKRMMILFALFVALFLTITIGCGNGGTYAEDIGENPDTPAVTDTAKVTITFGGSDGMISQKLVTPGVPPGQIGTFGTIESGICYDPHTPACLIDRTAQVVGGNLSISYTVPVNTYLHIGYALANQLRVDGIRINGTTLTTFAALGTAPYQWPVACFIVNRDSAGAITVGGNPACTAQVRRLQLIVTGDTGGSGLSSYTNGTYNMPYDDTLVQYTGAQAGEDFRIQTSLWANPTPGGVWQQLVWDGTYYSETFYSVLNTQAFYVNLHHPSREPTCMGAVPACPYVPEFGAYINTQPVTGGANQCTTQLVHYEDMDATAAFWYGATTTGYSTTTNCITQGADTRGVAVTGP